MSEIIYYLPSYYNKSIFLRNITESYDKELNLLESYYQETQNQFVVPTATKSLKDYELEYGLPINPLGITIDERRSRVMARMRGFGTATKAMIKKVIDSWTNGDVEIIEFMTHYSMSDKTHEQLKQYTYGQLNLNDYRIKVIFNSVLGMPSNMQDVYNAVSEIIPAHLEIIYSFKYRRHEELKSRTHYNLNGFTHDQIRQGVI